MLLTKPFYATFTGKPIADAHSSSQVLLCLSADSRGRSRPPRRSGRGRRQGRSRARSRTWADDVRPQLRGSRRPSLGADVDGPGSWPSKGAQRRRMPLLTRLALRRRAMPVEPDCHRSKSPPSAGCPTSPRAWSATCASAGRSRRSGATIGFACSTPRSRARRNISASSRSTRCRPIDDGEVQMFESGAILIHIGEQDERLLPDAITHSRMRAIAVD